VLPAPLARPVLLHYLPSLLFSFLTAVS